MSDGGDEALTSYLLVALLEATEGQVTPATLNAATCLLTLPTPSKHPYNLALRAYALALVRHHKAVEVLRELLAQAVVTSSDIHWELPIGHSE